MAYIERKLRLLPDPSQTSETAYAERELRKYLASEAGKRLLSLEKFLSATYSHSVQKQRGGGYATEGAFRHVFVVKSMTTWLAKNHVVKREIIVPASFECSNEDFAEVLEDWKLHTEADDIGNAPLVYFLESSWLGI